MNLIERIRVLLHSDGVPLEESESEVRFLTRCNSLSVPMRMVLGPNLVMLVCQIPIFVPIYRRTETLEAMARANWGMWIGAFEMDVDDGELRFRASIPTNDAELSDGQLRRLLSSSIGVISQYGAALLQVACTEAEPNTAIEKAEIDWKLLHQKAAMA